MNSKREKLISSPSKKVKVEQLIRSDIIIVFIFINDGQKRYHHNQSLSSKSGWEMGKILGKPKKINKEKKKKNTERGEECSSWETKVMLGF